MTLPVPWTSTNVAGNPAPTPQHPHGRTQGSGPYTAGRTQVTPCTGINVGRRAMPRRAGHARVPAQPVQPQLRRKNRPVRTRPSLEQRHGLRALLCPLFRPLLCLLLFTTDNNRQAKFAEIRLQLRFQLDRLNSSMVCYQELSCRVCRPSPPCEGKIRSKEVLSIVESRRSGLSAVHSAHQRCLSTNWVTGGE